MLSRTRDVIKNKNKIERAIRERRKNEITNIRTKSMFKAKMYEELRHIEVILQDDDVDAVEISVPDRFLAQFSEAVYSEELASYTVTQVDGESKKFLIQRKFIAF